MLIWVRQNMARYPKHEGVQMNDFFRKDIGSNLAIGADFSGLRPTLTLNIFYVPRYRRPEFRRCPES